MKAGTVIAFALIAAGCASTATPPVFVTISEPPTPNAIRIDSEFNCDIGSVRIRERVSFEGNHAIEVSVAGFVLRNAQLLSDAIVAANGDPEDTAGFAVMQCPHSRRGDGLSLLAHTRSGDVGIHADGRLEVTNWQKANSRDDHVH